MSDTNATPSAFGWDFQCNAAIVLLLDCIEDAKAVRVEGKTEDIEIYLKNGTTLYSQAKSVEVIGDYRNVIRNLKKAMKTLHNASMCTDMCKLVYVTNSPNPFNCLETMSYFYGQTKYKYNELPEQCRDKINSIIKDFENGERIIENLDICVIPFSGDYDSTRYRVIKERINELLATVGVNQGIGNKVLETWQNKFFHIATKKDYSMLLDKEDLVWPIIVHECDSVSSELYLHDMDEAEVREVHNKYREFIYSKSQMFEFISKVICDYSQCDKFHKSEKQKLFINEYWKEYVDDFEIDNIDNTVLETLIKIVLQKILSQRLSIVRIKEGVKL